MKLADVKEVIGQLVPDRVRSSQAIRAAERGDWRSVIALSQQLPPMYWRTAIYRITAFLKINQVERAIEEALAYVEAGLDVGAQTQIVGRLYDHGVQEGTVRVLMKMQQRNPWLPRACGVATKLAGELDEATRSMLREVLETSTRQLEGDALIERVGPPAFLLQRGPSPAFLPPGAKQSFRLDGASKQMDEARSVIEGLRQSFLSGLEVPVVDRVHCFRDVFVNPLRQIWTRDGFGIDSRTRALPSQAECEQRLADGSIPIVDRATQPGGGTKGIYHWLVDDSTRVTWLRERPVEGLKILITDDASAVRDETLRLYGLDTAQILRYDAPYVFCREFYNPGAEGNSSLGLRRFSSAFDAARDAALAEHGAIGPENLLISRRDSSRRVLRNQDAFEAAFADLGYESMVFSGLSFSRQIAIVASAKRIVALHGAGLSHLLFARADVKVGEILPYQRGHMNLRMCFARIAMARAIDHAMWVEDVNPVTQEWSLDIDRCVAFMAPTLLREGESL